MAVATRDAERGRLRALLRARTWAPVLIPLSVLCLVLAIAFAAEWLYQDRALPGVTVAGVDVGSLTRATLVERLDQEVATPFGQSAVVASADGHTWRSTNADLGIRPDVAAAADAALAFGKTGTVGDRLGAWFDALGGQARIPFALVATNDRLDAWLTSIASDVERPTVAGSLAVRGGAVVATRPLIGRRLDTVTSAASVLSADSLGDRTITLTVRDAYPEVDASGFDQAYAQLRAALTPLDVTVAERHVAVDATQLAPLVRVQLAIAKPGELPAVPGEAIAPGVRYRYVIAFDSDRVNEWVSALAASLDRPAVDARYAVSREGVLSVVPGTSGIKVDQDKLKALLATELIVPTSAAVRPLAAPAVLDTTSFTTEDAQKWLPQMVKTSSFTTYFPVSASRHANIATGSSQFDGVVIRPGATFSFWSLLGPVTPERGYAYAGAIINNRSDESVIGGGLCQVSTTMFNAIAKLGYEIVERHEHGYLIERYPLGLDAAVFDPGSDFQWKNDTQSPVFLWSWVSDTSVTFDVWGLPTGRTVTFSDPVQRNFVDVPADQAADPAFPAGYAIRGRDVVRTRTVTDASGTVIHQDTFFSHYAPVWGGPAPEGGTLIVR